MNPNIAKKDIYVGILYNMLEFPSKGIFSANQFRATGHFYDENPRKVVVKQSLVTMDVRESRMFVIDGIAYLPVRCPTYEDMESYPKVLLTLYVECNP